MSGGSVERIGLIALAGAVGTLSRYWLQGWVNDVLGPTVLGTFVVNVSGAFFLGIFVALTEERYLVSSLTRTVVAIGFFGAYTTFSTLMFESVDRLESGELLAAMSNVIGSVGSGLIAMYAGLTLGRIL